MQQTQTYRERSRAFLSKARLELHAGDLEQASEKGWGAASLMAKAAAEQLGLEHTIHRHLFRVVGHLERQTNDDELERLFHVANGLHGNFYENWFGSEQVERALGDVEQFVAKVEATL